MVNIGNVWDRTTAFIADNSRAILAIALPGIWLPLTASKVVNGAMQDCSAPMDPLAGGALTVVLMLPVLWGILALTALVVTGGGVAAARRASLGRLAQAVAAILLVVAVLVVAILPLMIVRLGNGPSFMASACADAAAASMQGANPGWVWPVYGIAWLVVAVFVASRLFMLYPVIVADGGIIGALRRAWQLSRGIVWKLIGVSILFQVVKAIAELAAASGFGLVAKIAAPGAGPFAVSTIIVAALVALVGVAFWVIVATFTALLYREVTGQEARTAA